MGSNEIYTIGREYESKVSLGYLNQSFQNAVMEGTSLV